MFFFFAGHGVALGAENYLLPRDLPKPQDGEENLVRDEERFVDELFDDTHEMWIRLDMNSRHIFWSHDRKTWNYIYNITAAK